MNGPLRLLDASSGEIEELFRGLLKIKDEVRVAMEGQASEAIESEIAAYEKAMSDVSAVFTEEEFRPFLSDRSELVQG